MLEKDSTFDIILRHRLLNTKQTTDNAVIWSTEWSTNDHIYNVGDIGHHKVESITSNVCGTVHAPTIHNLTVYKKLEHHAHVDP